MSTTSAVTGSSSSSSASTSTSSTSNVLGQDAFLKLLVTQLKNQDPMNPTDSTEFIAQLAQFSSVEQLTKANSTLSDINDNQSMLQAASLIGKTVTAIGSDSKTITGTVDSVKMTDGSITLTVDGSDISVSDITSVS